MKGLRGYLGESCGELKGPRVDLKALGEVAGSERVDLGWVWGSQERGSRVVQEIPENVGGPGVDLGGILEGFRGPKVDFMGI